MSALAWIAVGVGILVPNLFLVYVRTYRQKIDDSARSGQHLTYAQRAFWEAITRAAWLSPTGVGLVLYLLGYGVVEILFGSLATLAITLNLVLVGAVVGRGVRGLRMKRKK
ncbi:MAG TPA: hypothetical protein VEX36_06585 [Thermoleophilaceae bacterium]|nr:hypothetical protein [Thermoleophilaceae bacterium]